MNPIDKIILQYPIIGLSDTEIRGTLFLLAGIYSFNEIGSDEEDNNRLLNFSSVGPFDSNEDLPRIIRVGISSIYREIFDLFDDNNNLYYEKNHSGEMEIVNYPDPLLFNNYKNTKWNLMNTHKFFINISQEIGKFIEDRSLEESYSDGALFWQKSHHSWHNIGARILTKIGETPPLWFMYITALPNLENEFIHESAPAQKLFLPLIQGPNGKYEWAYSSLVCFDKGKMIKELTNLEDEHYFSHALQRMEFFKKKLNGPQRQRLINMIPEGFKERLYSDFSKNTEDPFQFINKFMFEYFGFKEKSSEVTSPLHERIMWQACVMHIMFCLGLKYDFYL
jgi:hypothetical protein